ncbi:MAG: hypothetical protein P9L88_03540 [Candidatus Tantalella remota]|nr:hypothetical protein [Candidatus Tantalella remota]
MRNILRDKKGFTLTEIMFVAVISVLVIGTVMSAWIFTNKIWSKEGYRTSLRIDLLKAMETMKDDIRLSSGTYMSFYPAASAVYTSFSLPLADTDANGFYTLDSNDEIIWDKTVVYHIIETSRKHRKVYTLRRSVVDSWNPSWNDSDRYDQLERIIDGTVSGDYTEDFAAETLDLLEITSASKLIDFYTDSSTPVKVEGVVLGYAEMGAGDHTITFTVKSKNADSFGYAFGIDSIEIEPSGSPRDVEYYNSSFASNGMLDSSGEVITIINDSVWRNGNYLEYDATIDKEYIEFTDYYDLWRDSAFTDASPDNVTTMGNDLYAKLELPEDREAMAKEEIVWDAFVQAGTSDEYGDDVDLLFLGYPITFRTLVTHENIDTEGLEEGDRVRGDLIRVNFRSSSVNPLKIEAAYITRRDGASVNKYDGVPNLATSGNDIDEYHRHQQLFFKDVYDDDGDSDTDENLPQAWIRENSEVWSEWVAFPLVLEDSVGAVFDYFITFHIPDLGSVSFPPGFSSFDPLKKACKGWINITDIGVDSYYLTQSTYTTELEEMAGTPVWTGVYTAVRPCWWGVYVSAEVDVWKKKGIMESSVFDTKKTAPAYNEVKWSEVSPSGTEVYLKARSSGNEDMVGATAWSSIFGSASNPATLSIGSGQYVQYMAELTTDPYWYWSAGTLMYADYVDEQESGANPYDFPTRSGEYLITGVYSAWIDDVEIDWAGSTQICAIKADIAQKDDYGQVSVRVDGDDVVKVLTVNLDLSKEFHGTSLTENATFEMEPRNTEK